MRLLVIGGTRFVGRHIVLAALEAGHEVTLFNRGQSGPELFSECTHLAGDRNTDLSALAEGTWDATIDTCGYFVRQVHALADALGSRGGHHVFVSSVSAYAEPMSPGFTEDSPLIELADTTIETFTDAVSYGGLKVACERAARQRHGEGTLIVRPTYVVGPDDYSWRFPWWVARIARGGEVLAPGPPDGHAQVIDARDMAEWIVAMVERSEGGTFHTVGPSATFTWGEMLAAVADVVAPPGTTLTWVDESFLVERGVDGSIVPLWGGGRDQPSWVMAADPTRALTAGLRLRPLADTIRDTRAWTATQTQPATPGLSPERESELLAEWADRSAS
jgi:2'-hydroxyisoflavone reductase